MSELLPAGSYDGEVGAAHDEARVEGAGRSAGGELAPAAALTLMPRAASVDEPRKAWVFWPLALCLVLVDCTTKELAETHLVPAEVPREIVGSVLRFTLGYNPGAAFGIHFPGARPILSAAALVIVGVLLHIYHRARAADAALAMALALVTGGAVGNLIDRIFSPEGVVDFIDVGIGSHRFWTFNLADVAITTGAALLVTILWRRDAMLDRAEATVE